MKTNITIRVKGFGWKWAHTPWSKGNKNLTIKELAKKLRTIIIKENKLVIPTLPDMDTPKRCVSGTLGTPTSDIMSLDAKYMDNKEELKQKAVVTMRERESSGVTSIYARMQPFYRPEVEDLVGRRIDVLYSLKVNGNDVLRWCQGEVLEVCENISIPKVKVAWDPAPDIAGSEEGEVSEKVLMPSLWNKDVDGAWRLDIDCFEDNDNAKGGGADICSGSSSLGTFGSDSDEDSFSSNSS